jgi:hypothetical protein
VVVAGAEVWLGVELGVIVGVVKIVIGDIVINHTTSV